jgi:hypothetical protein
MTQKKPKVTDENFEEFELRLFREPRRPNTIYPIKLAEGEDGICKLEDYCPNAFECQFGDGSKIELRCIMRESNLYKNFIEAETNQNNLPMFVGKKRIR